MQAIKYGIDEFGAADKIQAKTYNCEGFAEVL